MMSGYHTLGPPDEAVECSYCLGEHHGKTTVCSHCAAGLCSDCVLRCDCCNAALCGDCAVNAEDLRCCPPCKVEVERDAARERAVAAVREAPAEEQAMVAFSWALERVFGGAA